MFRDAGSLKCSMQMGFISSLELTLECSQPICPAGDQRRGRAAVSGSASPRTSLENPELWRGFPQQPLARAVAPAAELGYDDTAGCGEEEV